LLEVEDGLLDDVLEGDFGFVSVTQVSLFVFGDVVGPEDCEVRREVAEDSTDRRVAAALLVVDCEDHGTAAQPAHHGFLERDLVAEHVREFEDDVVHEVEHDQLEEVVLLEGFGEDDLIRDWFLVPETLLLDDLVLAGEQVLLGARVEHDDHFFRAGDVPVVALYVTHFDDVRVCDAYAVELGELVLHLVDHRADFLFQAR